MTRKLYLAAESLDLITTEEIQGFLKLIVEIMGADNPFTRVHNGMWSLLEADDDFNRLIKEGNKVRYDQQYDRGSGIKPTVITADMPEIAIIQTRLQINTPHTSSTTKFNSTFSIIVNSGDFRLNEVGHDINWVLLCRIAQWKTALGDITWKNEHFVKSVKPISDVQIGHSDPEHNRRINGWITVWAVEIECHLATANLTYTE